MAQNDQQLALLKNRLQMPLIVRELLSAGKVPSDEETYGLHHMLSEYSIEDALLCGAFVMKEIAALGNTHPSDMAFMHMECERLIERYSARDDLAQENPDLWSASQIDMLDDMAEDLECFLDLLALCKLSYEITAPCVTSILDILDTQLQSQLMMVDEIISMHQEQKLHAVNEIPLGSIETQFILPAGYGAYGDNIIPFPANRARQ